MTMTLPTKLTVLRIVLTVLVIALLFVQGWQTKATALVVFLLAGMTDWLDGYLARRWHQTSAFGALLDPIADKVLVLGVFLALVQLRWVPAWMVLIIALRELLVTGVRLYAANRHLILAAATEGKQKMVSQMVAIGMALAALTIAERAEQYGDVAALLTVVMREAVLLCLGVALVLTVLSGTMFFWKHREMLKEALGSKP